MASIRFATLNEADTRSKEMWTQILGRPKRAQDVTEYLYGRNVDPDTGAVTLDIPTKDAYLDKLAAEDKLTPVERTELEKVGWVAPKAAPGVKAGTK